MMQALVERTADDTFALYWDGSKVFSGTIPIPPDEDPKIPGDIAEELVSFAEANNATHQLRIAMLGGVEWGYQDNR